MQTSRPGIRIETRCQDLGAAIDIYCTELGFRLDMIMPADAPRIALLSGYGIVLRLECGSGDAMAVPPSPGDDRAFRIFRASESGGWIAGRAGMRYRDLLPGRLGGRVIASQIRIADGGPVPDYVHYHKVGFQMIHCRRGWVRVVYEDQGPSFILHAGDCVLQPPTIRHRVLEASDGLEVIEVGCPAEHETWRDHETGLPTPEYRPDRDFAGQRFVRHVAATARWQDSRHPGFEVRDTGIGLATGGQADVRGLRWLRASDMHGATAHVGDDEQRTVLLLPLEGRAWIQGTSIGRHVLEAGDACVIPAGTDFRLEAEDPCELLQVTLPPAP